MVPQLTQGLMTLTCSRGSDLFTTWTSAGRLSCFKPIILAEPSRAVYRIGYGSAQLQFSSVADLSRFSMQGTSPSPSSQWHCLPYPCTPVGLRIAPRTSLENSPRAPDQLSPIPSSHQPNLSAQSHLQCLLPPSSPPHPPLLALPSNLCCSPPFPYD